MDWMLSARLLHHAPPTLNRAAHSVPCVTCQPHHRRAALQPVAAAPAAAGQLDRALAEDQEREARQGELDTALESEATKPKGTDQKKKVRSRRFRAMADMVPGRAWPCALCPSKSMKPVTLLSLLLTFPGGHMMTLPVLPQARPVPCRPSRPSTC